MTERAIIWFIYLVTISFIVGFIFSLEDSNNTSSIDILVTPYTKPDTICIDSEMDTNMCIGRRRYYNYLINVK